MRKTLSNILLNKQPKPLLFLHTVLLLASILLLSIPIIYLDKFPEYKIIFLAVSYSVLIFFIVKQLFNLRLDLLKSLETIFSIKHKIEVDKNGISLKSKFVNKFYNWNNIEEVAREVTIDKSIFEITIVTSDSRIFTIFDDSGWSQFNILKEWIDSKKINDEIVEHYTDQESGVEI